jgi:hypothetical protein
LVRLNPEFAIEPVLVCSSGNQGIWILDKADRSLKRINLSQSTVEWEVPLPDPLKDTEIQFMREYQNFLFILDDKSRLFILNRIGQLVKEIKANSLQWFNFLGEELYYQDGEKIFFYDLFDGSTHEIDAEPTARFTLLSDERRFIVYEKRVMIQPVN